MPAHDTPALYAVPQPLPHTALRHASHLDSVPWQPMLFRRAVPGPGPNISSKISSFTALPEVPRLSCTGGALGRLTSTWFQNSPTAESPTCLHTTAAPRSSKPVLQAGVHLPKCSSSSRPATRPGVLMASARRAVTATVDVWQCFQRRGLSPVQRRVPCMDQLPPGCSVRQTTPTSSLWPLIAWSWAGVVRYCNSVPRLQGTLSCLGLPNMPTHAKTVQLPLQYA